MTEQDILNALGDGELSGSQILDRLDRPRWFKWWFGLGWLYPKLHEMEEQGLISSRWIPGPHPRRRVYRKVDTP